MIVRKMIEELQKCDPNARVVLNDIDSDEEVISVLSFVNHRTDRVCLASEYDTEMTEELEARLDWASENNIDEIEFYSDLLETGIDVDMVRKYLGEDQAKHMEEYCIEHGLI